MGVVTLNVFLARFGGLFSCSPCGGRFALEVTRVASIAWVTGSTNDIYMTTAMQSQHTCRRAQVTETKAILFVRMHDRTIQYVGMFCAQIIDPSVAMLSRNLSRPIDQPDPSLL